MKLEGKVALVTGAGAGIGRAIALRFAQEGAKVMVADCNRSSYASGEGTVKMIKDAGGDASFVLADVSKAADAERMVKATIDTYGKLDILVNNAGDIRDALLVKMTDEDWDFVVDLSLKGSFLCARAVAPHMIEQGYGKIVNISSLAYTGNVGQANYTAAKAGVVGLTRAIGIELARYGITVNCIAPGMIDTPRTRTLEEKTVERIVRKTPMRRMGEIVDIANAVLFLVSDDSKYITRQVIHVAGGMEGF